MCIVGLYLQVGELQMGFRDVAILPHPELVFAPHLLTIVVEFKVFLPCG